MNFQQLKILSFIQVKKNEKILQVDETVPEQPQPAVQSEEQPETITSNTDEQETIEDIENFIANKPTEEVTQKEAEITPDGQAKGNFHSNYFYDPGPSGPLGLGCTLPPPYFVSYHVIDQIDLSLFITKYGKSTGFDQFYSHISYTQHYLMIRQGNNSFLMRIFRQPLAYLTANLDQVHKEDSRNPPQ